MSTLNCFEMFNLMAVVINKQMNKVFIASILTSLVIFLLLQAILK